MDHADQFQLDGAFIRIGEDDDDIDRRSFNDGSDMISVNVSYSAKYTLDSSKDKRLDLSSNADLQSAGQNQGADT